jgi:HK97 gp10 family phage protein
VPATVTGIPEAQAAIQGVVDDAKSLGDVHRLIAQAGEDAARARAPMSTGRLSGSITGAGDDRQATLAVGVAYWPYQEFGTRHLRARRYMAKGISAMRKIAGREYRKKLGDGYRKRAKSARARAKG